MRVKKTWKKWDNLTIVIDVNWGFTDKSMDQVSYRVDIIEII